MIVRLSVSNLAVISQAELFLKPGLTVITGETGSGKTMLVRALRMAAGLEGDPRFVGPFGDETYIELELDCQEMGPLYDPEAKAHLAACRVNTKGRRYQSWGSSIASKIVRQELDNKVRFVRQGETQLLRSCLAQRRWLDRWANLDKQVAATADAWIKLQEAAQRLETCKQSLDRIDYERYELKDKIQRLSVIDLQVESYNLAIHDEKMVNEHSGLSETVGKLLEGLDSESGPWGEIESLQRLSLSLPEPAAHYFEEMIEAHSKLTGELLDLAESLPELDPDAVLERAGKYKDILRRYGPTIKDAQDALEKAQEELDRLDLLPEILKRAQAGYEKEGREYEKAAQKLTKARQAAGKKLTQSSLLELLEALGVAGESRLQLSSAPPGPEGVDEVQIELRSSAKSRWLALSEVSGGELSRVALALERLQPSGGTLILDEIDAGVGGQTAHKVAQQLKKLSKDIQVVAITHLPQIAKVADSHIVVEKTKDQATARMIETSEQSLELERMQGLVPNSQ